MARRARKSSESTGGSGVSAIRGNGYDPDAVKAFVERIENVQGQIDEVTAEAQAKIKELGLRQDMDQIKKEAGEAGIPRAELNALVRKRRLLTKAENVRAALNEAQQNNFDQLLLACDMLGELGEAAKKKALSGSARSSASEVSVGASA